MVISFISDKFLNLNDIHGSIHPESHAKCKNCIAEEQLRNIFDAFYHRDIFE